MAAVAGGHTNALEAAKPLWSGRDNCTNCRSLGNAKHVCDRSNFVACRRRGKAIAIANTQKMEASFLTHWLEEIQIWLLENGPALLRLPARGKGERKSTGDDTMEGIH